MFINSGGFILQRARSSAYSEATTIRAGWGSSVKQQDKEAPWW